MNKTVRYQLQVHTKIPPLLIILSDLPISILFIYLLIYLLEEERGEQQTSSQREGGGIGGHP